MVHYARGYGGLDLTSDQQDELRIKADALRSAIALDSSQSGLGGEIYAFLRDALSDANGDRLPTVDLSVWEWINGAEDVNAGVGPFGEFINDYTIAQYMGRYGVTLQEATAEAQTASNNIALNLAEDLLANSGRLPGIMGLAVIDAGAAASNVFNDVPTQGGYYAPWAGQLPA